MNATSETAERVYVSAEAAEAFTRQIMLAHGLPEQDAAIVAHCLVSADLRGVDTHGIARLPVYLDRVRRGLINAKPSLKPERVTPVAATLDGQDAFGFVVGMCAINEAMAMARELRHRRRVGAAQHPFRHGGVLRAARASRPASWRWCSPTPRRRCRRGAARTGCSAPIRSASGAPGGKHRAVPARHVARGRRARQDPARRAPRRDHSRRLRARRGRPRHHRSQGRARRRGAADRHLQGLRHRR